MEKEVKNIETVDEQGIGTVQIADEVVAVIVGIAATEVDGVAALDGNITNEIMSKVGIKNIANGVKIDIKDNKVAADVRLIVEYGYNIPVISQKVQAKVKQAIENMTGLDVTDVNVRIAGISLVKEG